MNLLRRLNLDPYAAALLATVALASLLPARGVAVPVLDWATTIAIALLFFLHGAKLPREAVIAGATNWRLHLAILCTTFVLFPILGILVTLGLDGWLAPSILSGILFLTLVPSTVQSSIAFTSMAGGNVAAAVFAASASNILGIVLTPLLAGLLMHLHGGIDASSIGSIIGQLFVPFALGQLLRPWIGKWVDHNKKMLGFVDRGSILLVVYGAFSEAVLNGLWSKLGIADLTAILVIDALILAVVLIATTYGSRAIGLSRADEIAVVFCGSKKSLAAGVPIASVLFSTGVVGVIVLPLMLFHQIQLMVCTVLARRYARLARVRPPSPETEAELSDPA